MPRIIFASDSHLNKHYARMTPEQLDKRRGQLRAAWRQTIDYALRQRADVYIHGGDLFDGPNPRTAELIWSTEQVRRLADAGVRVLLIGGNHDTPRSRLAGATPQRLFATANLAHVFTDPTKVTWWEGEVGGTRLAVGGLPPDPRLDRDADPLAELAEAIAPPPDADVVLLVTHYAVEGTLHPRAEEPVIRKASIADLAGRVDHLLVGHIHSAKTRAIAGVTVVSPGPTERLSFGEIDVECGFVEISVAGRRPCRVDAKRCRLDPQPMRRETVRATDIPPDDPTAWLVDRVREWSAPDQILQVRLEGPLPRPVYHDVRFLDVWQVGQDLNFYFHLDRQLLTVDVPGPGDLAHVGGARVGPRAEIERVAAGFMGSAADEAERALYREALALALDRYGGPGLDEDGAAVHEGGDDGAVRLNDGEGMSPDAAAAAAIQVAGAPADEPAAGSLEAPA